MRTAHFIQSLIHTAFLAVLFGFTSGRVSAHPQEPPSTLQQHVRAIERAIASRSLPTIREYLNPKKTFIDILGKPATYLSVNQAVAVIESFLRVYLPVGYALGLIKEGPATSIAISTLRVKTATGERHLKLTMGFTKDSETHWLINRIVIR